MAWNQKSLPHKTAWNFFLCTIITQLYPSSQALESSSQISIQRNPLGLNINSVLDIQSSWTPGVGEELIVTAYWPYLDSSITEDIRHFCGTKVFIPLLSRPSKDLRLQTSWKNISCSFYPDYALIKGESSLPLPTTSVKIIDLQINSFREDEEVCTLRLNGYEKHPSIFVAYSPHQPIGQHSDKDHRFPKGYSLVKFPHGLSTMLTANHLSKSTTREGDYYVIFDPEEGRGKSFGRITRCIETIIYSYQNFKTFNEDIISQACVIECDDDADEDDYDNSNPKRIYDEL